ncbi:MAG: Gfo/Idh/MocA family oxidoreductase, partial [bacterium]
LFEGNPRKVTTSGKSYVQEDVEDVAFMSVYFDTGQMANFHSSWLDPQTIRRLTVVGDEKMAVFDDTKSSDKLAIHEKGAHETPPSRDLRQYDGSVDIYEGETVFPPTPSEEPLLRECRHFLDCIKKGDRPITDGYHAVEIINVLQAAEESMKAEGKPVEIELSKGDVS